MRFIRSSALVLALCVAGAPAAFAEDNSQACNAAESQVSAALQSASQNADAARHEKRLALQFCTASRYSEGLAHYSRAMELLGTKLARS